jgi:cyd operon protein YbgT
MDWILGLGLAAAFSILNALWLEVSPGNLDAPQGEQDAP